MSGEIPKYSEASRNVITSFGRLIVYALSLPDFGVQRPAEPRLLHSRWVLPGLFRATGVHPDTACFAFASQS